jgi:hypothetical protein
MAAVIAVGGVPAASSDAYGTSVASARADMLPPAAEVETVGDSPVKKIKPDELRMVGQKLDFLFRQYVSDRRIAELRWLRNERQYLGIYDPEIEKELSVNRSKAYPRVTRVKCISVLSRLMNLMFPGNERNWEIRASPSADMKISDVKEAIANAQKADKDAGVPPAQLTLEYVMSAVQTLADKRAEDLSTLIDDQLEELGGDQTLDYIALNRSAIRSGIIYGLGLLRGPYACLTKATVWEVGPDSTPTPKTRTAYKPQFEFLRVWDFYPDLSAKTFDSMDGYFTRVVMSRAQVRDLARREDFFADQITEYLTNHQMGNYRPQPFETELRAMGVKVNVNEMKTETSKYEVIVWHGQTSGTFLSMCGVDVPKDKLADDVDAEIWMIDANVIKATLNPWEALGVKVKTIHTFLFDEDDTSPIGLGLPTVIRDSQMSISASTRMLLDNASIVCGPNLELNTDLLRPDQDLTSTSAYKMWYREGTGIEAKAPAVTNVQIDSHLDDLMKVIELFQHNADMETFVGPATGGDMAGAPSEPMRTAAGASMIRGDAALPFKDIVRHFDSFTQSILESLVQFNRKFNPRQTPEGDYNVIARGATSLVAKEIRGIQMDQLAQTLQPEERLHIDDRKWVKARFAARDLTDMLVSEEVADRRKTAQDQQASQAAQQQAAQMEATIRQTLADAFKNIAQGQKNAANADATAIETALDLLERGMQNVLAQQVGTTRPDQAALPSQGNGGDQGDQAALAAPSSGGQGGPGGMPGGDISETSGGGSGLSGATSGFGA